MATEKPAPSQGPEKEFRAGLVRATVWRNTRKNGAGQEFEALSVRVERRYQDKDGNWQSTSSFRPPSCRRSRSWSRRRLNTPRWKPGRPGSRTSNVHTERPPR